MQHGDFIIDCDSDDYFTDDAFRTMYDAIQQVNKEREDNNDKLYAIGFLRYNQNNKNIGQKYVNDITTMFDLHFREGDEGEKSLLFYADIRKKYEHKLEKNEKFITEARMYYEMDLKYNIRCFNKPVIKGEYRTDGYTKNIIKVFKQNPYGYYKYFEEIFNHNTNGILLRKRLYIIKHYILFSYLTKAKGSYKKIKGFKNKLLYIILYIPGTVMSGIKFK